MTHDGVRAEIDYGENVDVPSAAELTEIQQRYRLRFVCLGHEEVQYEA
jgi:hypothetical protein